MNSLSIAVVEAVAEEEGIGPDELTPPLNEVIDADALDRLFDPRSDGVTSTPARVVFRYAGYDVTVFSDGSVELS